MKRLAVVLATLAAMVPMASSASEALADRHGCLNCHGIDNKVLGPSFKDIAEKYRGQAGADEMLIGKVVNGSVGVWGRVPMPGMRHVPSEDTRAIVDWLLKL